MQISHLEALPDRAIEDDQSIELLKSYLKGGTKERKGTLQEYMAKMGAKENASKSQYFMICMQFQMHSSTEPFRFPQHPKPFRLREIAGLYKLIIKHLQSIWSTEFNLYSDTTLLLPPHGVRFSGTVDSFPYVLVRKKKYGCANMHRGKSARYAYVDNRIPVEIQYIFRVTQQHLAESPLESLIAEFAVVKKFQRGDDLPNFPWEMW